MSLSDKLKPKTPHNTGSASQQPPAQQQTPAQQTPQTTQNNAVGSVSGSIRNKMHDFASSVNNTMKSAYQQNVAQPVSTNWYSGAIPTKQEIYGRIYDISKTDKDLAVSLADQFSMFQADSSSPYYEPYRQATNESLSVLAGYGIDVSNIDQQWFQTYSFLMDYTPSNAKKASAEQKAAYAYQQTAKAYDDTTNVQKEYAALQEEINYLANWTGRNYSDQQIKDMIYGKDDAEFAKKYPTLAKLDASLGIGGKIMSLNAGTDYSKDGIDTMIWRARNNGGTGNFDFDTMYSVIGHGNGYQENPDITKKLNWNDAENYSPFSTGMTLVEEGMYFGMYEFTPEIIEQLRATLDPNDATAMKMFDNVVAAEDTTEKGEAERDELYGKVDEWITKGYSAEKIMQKVDYLLDKNKYPTLSQMDKSMRSSDQKLIPTTRAIDYKYEDLKRYVEGKINTDKKSGVEESSEILTRAGVLWNGMTGQDAEIDKAQIKEFNDTIASVEDDLTDGETSFMTNASSSYWNQMVDGWDDLNEAIKSGKPINEEFALAQMEKADKEYTASAFTANQTISDYESKQQLYNIASAQYKELSKLYSDQQYIGVVLGDAPTVDIDVNGSPTQIRLKIDPETGKYVFDTAVTSNPQYFRTHIENQEGYSTAVEKAVADYNEYAENVERVRAEGHRPTKEGQEGLQQMYTAKALMEDAKSYMDENKAAYDEAVIAERKAREKLARSYSMLKEIGFNTDNGDTHLAMLDYALQYGKKKQKEKFAYSDINAVDDIIREDSEGKYSVKDFAEATTQTIAEIDEQIADITFLMTYFGDEIPENYRNGMKDQIAELEWQKKDYEYFLLGANDDWDEMVAKGKEENIWTNLTPLLGQIDNDIRDMWWSTMTDEEKDRFNYLVGKEGTEAAKEYFVHLQENGMLDKRRMDTIKGNAAEAAEKYPVLSNAFAIVTAPISGIGSAVSLLNTALTGESSSDKMSMFYNNVANEINQTTVQKIQEAFKDNPVAREIVQGAYEIVYNRGRSAMNAFLFPGLGAMSEFVGAVPMAATAMADEVMKLKDAGVDDAKAWLLGSVTFLCEAGTEMIELKDIKAAKELGLNTLAGIKDFLKQYPIAGLNEALGESLNDIIENAADRIVLGDDGERAERAWYYRTTLGMSKEDAEAKAYQDEIYGVLHTAIISFLSPGMDVMSYASGRIALNEHYKRQAKDYNMSLRDIRTNEQTRARYAQQEERIGEKATSVPTIDVEGAQQEIKTEKTNNSSYIVDMEVLETAGQTADPNARSSALASVLATGESDAESETANAAAVNINNAFEGGVDEVQELMQGGLVAGVDPVQLKKGIQYAALGKSIYGDGACYRLVHSDEYRNAMPDDKATMLAAAAQADEQNQNVQKSVADAVRENRIAEQEAILIRNGALSGTQTAEQAANASAAEVRKANDEVEARRGEAEAAAQALDAATKESVNNPSDQNTKQVVSEAANVRKKDESVKQYEQHQANMVAKDEKASADLEAVRQRELSAVRQQAEAVVAQQDQQRAQIAQQKAEQEQLAKQVREQAIKDAKEIENFSRLDAEEQIDKLYPNLSKADRARAIRLYMNVQRAASSGVQSVQARQAFTNKLAKKFGLKVQTVPSKGNVFNARIDPTTRTLYVNEKTNQSDVMYAILIHEITHPAENAKGLYTELANMVLAMRYGNGVTYNGILSQMAKGDVSSRLAQDILAKKSIYDKYITDRPAHSNEEMLQEIVADGVGYIVAGDQKAIDQLVAEKPSLAKRILASIKNFINKMSGVDTETMTQAQKVADMLEKSLKETWGDQKKSSIDQTQALVTDDNGNALATQLPGGTVSVDRFSLNSFDAEEQMRVRDALRNAVDEEGNRRFTDEEIDKYMDDALGIASMIAADRDRLDFVADPTKTMLKPNAEYVKTLDASTLCAKRLLYQGTFDEIQHLLPNTPLLPEDLIDLSNMMREMGYETPCGICYVESRRRQLGKFTEQWLESYDGEYKPTLDQVTTSDGLEELRKTHPQAYQDFITAMNKKGTMNPKVVQLRTDYRGEISEMTPGQIQKVKDIGGLRIQSFSDFETPHLLDMAQAVMDMSAKGLTAQAYTKVPNFPWVFGDTGIKINLSLIGKGTGLDENGNLVFDDVEGMPFEEAMKLRDRYSKNVGTILVGINDDHIRAAMADDRIDFIIPFHKSGWSKGELDRMPVLNGYSDYTDSQNEKAIIGRTKDGGYKTESLDKSKRFNFQPVGENGYWDFSKSGKENAEAYLEMCAKDGRLPKFSQFLVDNGDGSFSLQPDGSTDGYWKTLIDFKMYDNDGVGSPQMEVTPNINMPEAVRVLDEYSLDRNGITRQSNNDLPVAMPVVERYVEEYKEKHPLGEGRERYSLPSDAPYLSAVNHGDMEEAQRLVDEAADAAGYTIQGYHGTTKQFTTFDKQFAGKNWNGDSRYGPGFYFAYDKDTALKWTDGMRVVNARLKMEKPLDLRGTAPSDIADEIIKYNQNKLDNYDPSFPISFEGYRENINRSIQSEIDNPAFFLTHLKYDENGKMTDGIREFLTNLGYDGIISDKEMVVFDPEQIKSADPVTYDDSGNVIPLSERFNTSNPDIRYSLPSDDILEQQFRYAVENGEETVVEPKDRQWGIKGLQNSDEIAQEAKDYVLAHNKYYPDTNEEQINRAIDWIRSQKTPRDPDGYNAAFQKVTAPGFNFRSADGQAKMIAMMGMAVARNDVPGQVQLSNTYNQQGTVLGQALQARKLWKLMTPEGRISSLQKMLETTQAELDKRGIVLDHPLKFSDWVYLAATAEQEDGDMQRLYQMAGAELAQQIPANWKDKIRSFRMLAMLGNPRTHIRNIIGNAMFVPAVGLKNKIAAIGEAAFVEPGQRTKTLSPFLSKEARAFAKEDALRMKDELTGEAKYNELNAVQKEQKAFKGLLQAVIDFNGDALEKEDWHFLRGHYVRALGSWMMANNYTSEQLYNNPVLLEQGRAYAIQEAQKATYRDFSKMASVLNKVSREGGVAGFVVDAVLPFKKTPANILKRGIEYSPVGLMKSLTTDIYHMKQWNDAQAGKYGAIPEKAISPTQFIDRLSSGLSGSAIMAIGYLMSRLGLVTCGLNDDDDELEKIKGAQKYAIKILGTDVTYTMDWAAPMSMPFFVGAAVQQQLGEQDGFDVDDIIDALGNISEPVFNLSMLDGVNTLFKTSQYDDTNTITQIGAKIGSNYVTSYVPSLLGAITRTFADDKRRKSYVKSGEGTGVLGTLRYAWEQTENKLPGLSQTNIPYRDVWGNPEVNDTFGNSGFAQFVERAIENFLSPGYISRTKSDPVLTEISRLYDVTHDNGLIPTDPNKSVSYKNQRYALTAEEWDKYKETRGQTALNCLTELMATADYKNATEDEQAQMVKNIWSYADSVGKAAVIPDYLLENAENPIEDATKSAKVTRYKAKMLQALGDGDIEGYETMVEALREAEVSDSTIKSNIRNAYHDKYITAYLKDDYETMSEIESILDNTEFDFDLDEWEEKADEKYRQ